MPVRVLPSTDRLAEPLRRFLDRLSPEQTMLLVLKRELYDGNWQAMIADLQHRLEGKPHVFTLATRIEDDLARIQQMQQLESHYEVDLAQFIAPLDEQEI